MKLSCMDLDPKIGCDFEAMGNNEQEVAQKMISHLKKNHPDKIREMKMSDDKIMSWLESKVHA